MSLPVCRASPQPSQTPGHARVQGRVLPRPTVCVEADKKEEEQTAREAGNRWKNKANKTKIPQKGKQQKTLKDKENKKTGRKAKDKNAEKGGEKIKNEGNEANFGADIPLDTETVFSVWTDRTEDKPKADMVGSASDESSSSCEHTSEVPTPHTPSPHASSTSETNTPESVTPQHRLSPIADVEEAEESNSSSVDGEGGEGGGDGGDAHPYTHPPVTPDPAAVASLLQGIIDSAVDKLTAAQEPRECAQEPRECAQEPRESLEDTKDQRNHHPPLNKEKESRSKITCQSVIGRDCGSRCWVMLYIRYTCR